MSYLYLLINLLSISVPFLVSFHRRVQLYKYFIPLFIAICLAMTPYIIWDIWFTESEYWGFNPDYLIGVYILGLPLEEWLFFICIPYACVFTHEVLSPYIPKNWLSGKWVHGIFLFLVLFVSGMGVIFSHQWYTVMDALFFVAIFSAAFFLDYKIVRPYLVTFIVILVPFLIVNGILTGSFLDNPIVWYNDAENMGIRVFTIPVEDFFYAFSLILLNLLIFRKLRPKGFYLPVKE